MTEPLPLPDGDDPYEILGIEFTTDAKEIKRAYVRRIKVYRPETHPVDFARIRAAYQTALRSLASTPAPSAGIAWSETDERTVLLTEAWALAGDGDADGAREAIARLQREYSEWAAGHAHGFLIEEALGTPAAEAMAALLRGLRADAPVADWAYALLDQQELREHTARPEFSWLHLRGQPDRDTAIMLFRYRTQAGLARGEVERVREEIDAPEYVDDALDDPRLGDIARQVMAVIAWDDPEAAEGLFVSFPAHDDGDGPEWAPEDLYVQAVEYSAAWRAWSAGFPDLATLGRFLRVSMIADPPLLVRLAAELHGEFLSRPERYLEGFDAMAKASSDLLQWTVSCLREYSSPADTEEMAMDTREANRMWQVIQAADESLSRDMVHRLLRTALGAVVIGALLSFIWVGFWGFAVIVGALVVAIALLQIGDRYVYRRRLRGPLTRTIVETPIRPSAMVRWIEANEKQIDRLDSFTDEIEEDLALEAMALTRALGDRPA